MDLTTSATLAAAVAVPKKKQSMLNLKADGTEAQVDAELLQISGIAMTVPYEVIVDVSSSHSFLLESTSSAQERNQKVNKIVEEAFSHVEATFSPYARHSELYILNNTRGSVGWVEVSLDFYTVMQHAETLNKLSEGLFDPTAAKFGEWYTQQVETLMAKHPGMQRAEAVKEVEGDAACQQNRKLVGWSQTIELKQEVSDGKTRYYLKKRANVHIDLCGLSKGWCVDYLVETIQAKVFDPPTGGNMGMGTIHVDWGGDSRTVGLDPINGGEWGIKVYLPDMNDKSSPASPAVHKEANPCAALIKVPRVGGAVCTSGDYFQRSVATGYTHITHPLGNAEPLHTDDPSRVTSCTVVTSEPANCEYADALATILMLLPQDQIQSWVKKFNEDAAQAGTIQVRQYVTIDRQGTVFDTKRTFYPTQPVAPSCPQLCPTTFDTVPPAVNRSALFAGTKRLLSALPRVVHVMMLHDLEGGEFSSFACTLTSAVQESAKKKAKATGHKATFSLMQQGFAAKYLTRGSTTNMPMSLSLFCLPEGAAGENLATLLGAGQFNTSQGSASLLSQLQEVCGATGWIEAQGRDGITSIGRVGDHLMVALCGTLMMTSSEASSATSQVVEVSLEEMASRKSASFPRVLLRGDRSYAQQKATQYSRPVVVATCSTPDSPDKFTGVTLSAVEFTSRDPPLLTAIVPDHKLSRTLFPPGIDHSRGGSWVPHVRLHFVTNDHEGKGFVDWFSDGSTTDGGMQFMYFTPPPNVVKLSASAPHSDASETGINNKARIVSLRRVPTDEGSTLGRAAQSTAANHRSLVVPYNFSCKHGNRTLDACLVGSHSFGGEGVSGSLLVVLHPLGSQGEVAKADITSGSFPLS